MKILILGGDSFIGKYYYKFSKLTNLLRSSREKKEILSILTYVKMILIKLLRKTK